VSTFLVVGFLLVHGLLHLALWLPRPQQPEEPGKAPPFHPDHSALLTEAHVEPETSHRVAVWLAVAAAVLYGLAGVAVAFGGSWAVPLAVLAATVGLSIKFLFFHPWLSVGIALDALVLSSALAEWPVALV
jgi:hypothetical protein